MFEEAEANKAAGKYDNASIDYQIEFYRNEGLTHYSPAKLPITSGQWSHNMIVKHEFFSWNLSPVYFSLHADVPEGCVIIREHVPITNLFTCLWFNEVDRFTSRDQISFSTVRDKIRAQVGWMPDMFQDCERRNFVVQVLQLIHIFLVIKHFFWCTTTWQILHSSTMIKWPIFWVPHWLHMLTNYVVNLCCCWHCTRHTTGSC